ncbi:stage III sporulation protein AE [Youxingia wuxianensis]|uniref:Stage III sporulation protein AE n=1 Tax=Youxingia wuxianensis TaxID=2763678 RepID=A0A926ELQ3_9FIRM|nr:stage III sporulation protein AE [Youxingia wuxianensis]MBC8584198.1 stage III sporulation protein AE [Youxingia wuxianensis]
MVKRVFLILGNLFLLCLLAAPVYAQEIEPPDMPQEPLPAVYEAVEYDPESDLFENQLAASGARELLDNLPNDAQELMNGAGITDIDYQQLLSLSPGEFFKQVWQMAMQRIKLPLTVFCSVLGTILLCALLDSLKTALWEGTISSVFSAVAVVCVAGSITAPIVDCITYTVRSIHDCSNFILTFIPVFSSVVTVSGQPVTATTYTAFLFAACQVVSQIVGNTLVPLMGIYLAFCIAGSLSSGIQVTAVAKAIKSIVSWTLGLLLTLFVGLMSLQTMVASGSDTVAAKAAKFLIGSFVPVVGGALSDAFAATQGYLRLLRTTVGAFGIIVALMTFLPVFLQTVIWYFTVNITGAVSDMLGIRQVGDILKSAGTTLGILMAVILSFAMLVIIATSIVLMTGTGV